MLFITLGSALFGALVTAVVFTHNSKQDVAAAYRKGLSDGVRIKVTRVGR